MIDTKEPCKKYAVCWGNDCGYGTDYFLTPEERDAEMAAIQNTGTDAWPLDLDDQYGDEKWDSNCISLRMS